jgi:hypothetical protein
MSTASTIQQYYNAFYGRPADPSGLAFWVAGVNGSGDLIGAALKVFGSASTPEFALRYPAGTSTSTFLDTAYGNMFNRTPDADGKRFWEAAFTNWVAGGKSEGEARALILQNFVDSANAQVGTADKLTITNKLTVADMMTASVKAYGTETVYLSGLNKAQKLLAGVDAGQPSVDAALAKIKAGGIYEQGEPVPATAVFIDSFNTSLGLVLSDDVHEILRFDSSPDAPFSYAKSGNLSYLKGLGVSKFDLPADRIDLTAFHLTPSNDFVAVGAFPWSLDESSTFGNAYPAGYRTHTGFFAKSIMTIGAGSGTNQSTEIFVDVNHNGDLEPGIDLWISLVGVWQGSVTAGTFIV